MSMNLSQVFPNHQHFRTISAAELSTGFEPALTRTAISTSIIVELLPFALACRLPANLDATNTSPWGDCV